MLLFFFLPPYLALLNEQPCLQLVLLPPFPIQLAGQSFGHPSLPPSSLPSSLPPFLTKAQTYLTLLDEQPCLQLVFLPPFPIKLTGQRVSQQLFFPFNFHDQGLFFLA